MTGHNPQFLIHEAERMAAANRPLRDDRHVWRTIGECVAFVVAMACCIGIMVLLAAMGTEAGL